MNIMLAAGHSRIDVSIEKWRQIVEEEADLDTGDTSSNCALCDKYFCRPSCPLAQIGDCCISDEYESTYRKFVDAIDCGKEEALEYAKKMLSQLQKCKELGYTD